MPFFSLPTGGASPVLAGNGAPTGALGNLGDLYLDKVGRYLYGPKTLNGWGVGLDVSSGPTGPTGASVVGPTGVGGSVGPTGPSGVSIVGPTGATGASVIGPTGPSGRQEFYSQSAAPVTSTTGAVWLDDDTGRYFVRYGNVWVEIGVQGERGPTGSAGPTGAAGGRSGATVATLSVGSPVTLTTNDPRFHFYTADPNGVASVTLPASPAAGFDFVIANVSDPSFNGIEIKTAGNAAVTTVYNQYPAMVVWDGSTWQVMKMTN